MPKTIFVKSFFLSCFVLLPFSVKADTGKLTGQEIKETFSEASLTLDTPFGTTLPIYFGKDGIISGKAGGLASYLGSSEDRGRWWITKDKLCLRWFKWLNSETQCFGLQLKERQVSWTLENGLAGTATLSDKPAVKAYLLKTSPQLVHRRPSMTSKPLEPKYATVSTGFFSLGIGLSQVLKEYTDTAKTHDVSKIAIVQETSAPSIDKLTPLMTLSRTASEQGSGTMKVKEVVSSPIKILSEANSENKNMEEKYLSVAGVETGDTLKIRSGPSPDWSIVGSIPQNSTKVKFLGPCQNLWCRVQFRNVNGWVSKYYLADSASKDPTYN